MIRSGLFGSAFESSAGATWIADADALGSVLAKLNRSVLNESVKRIPTIDFARDGVLLIWMGDKPSGGYGIELIKQKSHVRDGCAFVAVRWIEPAQGTMAPQVITHPYVLIRMNKSAFKRIVVVDQDGISRVALDITKKM